ncbi:hypothetical protein HDV63DRAFT_402400 [Trichoderma sp. SZMC 28014]
MAKQTPTSTPKSTSKSAPKWTTEHLADARRYIRHLKIDDIDVPLIADHSDNFYKIHPSAKDRYLTVKVETEESSASASDDDKELSSSSLPERRKTQDFRAQSTLAANGGRNKGKEIRDTPAPKRQKTLEKALVSGTEKPLFPHVEMVSKVLAAIENLQVLVLRVSNDVVAVKMELRRLSGQDQQSQAENRDTMATKEEVALLRQDIKAAQQQQ